MFKVTFYATLVFLCGAAQGADMARATALAQQSFLADTHIDVPWRIHDAWEDVSARTATGDFDYERARAGGLDLAFMSIYVPATEEAAGTAYALANTLIDHVEAMVYRAPEKFALVTSPDEALKQMELGRVGLAMGMENGAPVAGDLDKLRHFYRRGIRYITLTHSLANHISDSSYDKIRLWQGLSPFGVEVVREMNALGILVDISHVSDDAFYDVLAVTTSPVIATHSSARAFTPGFERNMSDEMILALAKQGGLIMINFGSSFLLESTNAWSAKFSAARSAYRARNAVKSGSSEDKAFAAAYREANPFPYATVADVADHIEHVVKIAGIEHVGLGSDYDGVGDSLPIGLKDASTYPNLVAELLDRGFSDAHIQMVLGENLLRVWRVVASRSAGLTD